MASNARKASSTGHTDQERARLRGKGRERDGSVTTGEGYIFEGEIGLRGYRTPEEDVRQEQKRYHPPAPNPAEGL
jgi:hypothetical protein